MFQVLNIPRSHYQHLYGLSDEALKDHGAEAVRVEAYPAYPCRVSLDFAKMGERVILLNHRHLDVNTPYRSHYAIYIRDGIDDIRLEPGQLPPVFLRKSPLAVRAFGVDDRLKCAQIVEAPDAAAVFEALLANAAHAYLHCHYAAYGCFAAKVVRA